MSTIQELIDSGDVVLGKTKVEYKNCCIAESFVPYFHDGCYWVCKDSYTGRIRKCGSSYIQVYQEPVEMEDRWLWAYEQDGRVRQSINFYATEEQAIERTKLYGHKNHKVTKVEGSKISWPKEKK